MKCDEITIGDKLWVPDRVFRLRPWTVFKIENETIMMRDVALNQLHAHPNQCFRTKEEASKSSFPKREDR